jgi:hypothetical protein
MNALDGVAELPLWQRVLILLGGWVALLILGGALLAYGRRLRVQGRQHLAEIVASFKQLAGTPYVLYLRPFVLDSVLALPPPDPPGWFGSAYQELPNDLTVEQLLIRQLGDLGPVVALGQPGEELPHLGARRGYLTVDGWQNTVSELIQGARVVVMLAAASHGTVWEFLEVLRTGEPTRLVLLVYGEPREYDSFRALVAHEYATRSPTEPAPHGPWGWPPLPSLPDIPPPPSDLEGRWDLPLQAIVMFDASWRASVTRFDLIVPRLLRGPLRRLVRRGLKQMLAPLARLPQVQPPRDIMEAARDPTRGRAAGEAVRTFRGGREARNHR